MAAIEHGHCLCGAVAYEAAGASSDQVYCHCRMCRRASGAVAVAWVTFAREGFRFVRGTPAAYRSSPHAVRRFCPDCGSPLTFEDDRKPDEIDVTAMSLDNPDAHPPDHHIWTTSRVRWWQADGHIPAWPERKR